MVENRVEDVEKATKSLRSELVVTREGMHTLLAVAQQLKDKVDKALKETEGMQMSSQDRAASAPAHRSNCSAALANTPQNATDDEPSFGQGGSFFQSRTMRNYFINVSLSRQS